MPQKYSQHILRLALKQEDALDFFLDTQFAFASLVESDKRDASNNTEERRREGIGRLSAKLTETLRTPPRQGSHKLAEKTIQLNVIRSEIRQEALEKLNQALVESNERIFCLTAPTGAGKTLTLLALANAILLHRNNPDQENPALRSLIYCLPFLSITEQVENECSRLLDRDLMLRADSRAHNPEIERLLEEADSDPKAAERLLREDFAEQVFDCPLTITTFVQFFETLMSNRNATLLKLPNFARSVILIDEVQALPPRLYVFFSAYLDVFCRKFDSYVILSTATMPQLTLPEGDRYIKPQEFFPTYREPRQLVSLDYFGNPCFRRYTVEPQWDICSIAALASAVRNETKDGRSVMVVLNTIKDTRDLYEILDPTHRNQNILLLNTRFITEDRRNKIDRCRELEDRHPLILITTQLIEAGVHIDFPVVFRDLCPLPSLVQTAGRCNRDNKLSEPGRVKLVDLKDNHNRSRAKSIYLTDMDDWYLNFTREYITSILQEDQLLDLQRVFFDKVNVNLRAGSHPGLREIKEKSNLILCIRDAAFEDVGRFRLIQEQGEQYAFYVPKDSKDNGFERLRQLTDELAATKRNNDPNLSRQLRIATEAHLRKMGERIVQARIRNPLEANRLGPEEPVMGIRKLGDRRNYTFEFGLEVAEDDNFF